MRVKENLDIEDFKCMEKLESKYYEEDFISPYEEAYSWYEKYNYSIKCIEDNDKIIGFINMFPVSNEVYELLKEGSFNDKYLELKDLIDLNNYKGKSLNLFLSCILIDEEYRSTNGLEILLREYIELYKEVDKKFKIENIITDNVTESGERFSKKFGFKKIAKSNHNSIVYEAKFEDFVEKYNGKYKL